MPAPPQPKGSAGSRGCPWGERYGGAPLHLELGPRLYILSQTVWCNPRWGWGRDHILLRGLYPPPEVEWQSKQFTPCTAPGWRPQPGQGQGPQSSGMSKATCSQRPHTGHMCTRPATRVLQVGYVCAPGLGGHLDRGAIWHVSALLRPAPCCPLSLHALSGMSLEGEGGQRGQAFHNRVRMLCVTCFLHDQAGETMVGQEKALPDRQTWAESGGVTFTWKAGGLCRPGVHLRALLFT